MNDPNKRIDVNLSSLLSLKAELLRKQEEVNRIKKPNTSDPFAAFNSKRPSTSSSKRSNDKKHDKKHPEPKPNAEKSIDEKRSDEDHEMLARSKKILEAKAKLYEKMTSSGGSLNSDDTCLVRFNQKKQDGRQPVYSSSESDSDADDHRGGSDTEDADKWTEYTDCLGRTRKCLKEDLDFFKKKDLELSKPREKSEEKQTPWFIDTKGISSADLPLYKPPNDDDVMSMISKSTKIDEMRSQWEHKEQDNLNRDKIHYQDVLFNEARTHGVGFYSFSTDAEERAKQQKKLETERDKTLEEQKKREEVRLARARIVAERVFAAKNRQRARLGLPAMTREEFDAEEKKNNTVEEVEVDPKDEIKKEKEQKKKEKLEREKEKEREQHLRPWDEGKDGRRKRAVSSDEDDEWRYKPEKPEPMSQQQWNEVKRAERNAEFAPPSMDSYNRFTTKKSKPAKESWPSREDCSSRNKSSFENMYNAPIQNELDDFEPPMESSQLNRFTTKKPVKRRNETSYDQGNMYNQPIRNELDGNDFPVDDDEPKRKRAEIAPPATFDYYGPTSSSKPKPKGNSTDITASIEAGLKFLREKSDKNAPATKQAWAANTSYEE